MDKAIKDIEETGPARSALFMARYGLALLGGFTVYGTVGGLTKALRMAELDPAGKDAYYAFSATLGTVILLAIMPLAGRASDTGAFGLRSRSQWILAGVVGLAISSVVLGAATTVPILILGAAMVSLSYATVAPSLYSIMNDEIPPRQQGVASALVGTSPLLGVVVGGWIVRQLPPTPWYMFLAPALVGCLAIAQFAWSLDARGRKPPSALAPAKFTLRSIFESYRFNPGANPPLSWLMLSFVLSSVGSIVMTIYVVFMLQDSMSVPQATLLDTAYQALAAINLMGAIFCIAAGILVSFLGRTRMIYAAGLIFMAAGLVVQATSPSVVAFLIGCTIAGVGYGITAGLTWAMAVQAISGSETAARDMALVSISLTVPGIVTPMAVPFVIAVGEGGSNYTLLYMLAAASTALSLLPLQRM